MKKRTFFCISLFIVLVLQTYSEGSVVTYTMDITTGITNIPTVGWMTIDGSFNLTIDYNSGYADLEDIDISFSNPAYPLAFDWSWLEGTYNFGTLFLSSPGIGPDSYLTGTFDGNTTSLQGTIYDNVYDGYQYACMIDAVVTEVIPEPATIALLALGGLALKRKK